MNKINWVEIFDGGEHILYQDVHFKTNKAIQFSKYIYQKMREFNVKGKFSVSVSDDNLSVIVRPKLEKANQLVLRNNHNGNGNVIDGEIVQKNDKVQNNKIDKIIKQHSVQLIESVGHALLQLSGQGGEREVEKLKYDDLGNQIPIYREFTGGYKIQIGFETTNEIIKYGPTEKVELRRPQDFTCSVKRMAGIVAEIAKISGFDISKWYFDDSGRNVLTIYSGKLAESRFSEEANPKDLLKSFKSKPLTADTVSEWMSILEKDGLLILWEGTHFPAGCSNKIINLMNSYYPDYEFYGASEKDNETGWSTLKLTMRKPMLTRANPGMDGWEGFMQGENGKTITQPYVENLELEKDGKLLVDKNYAKRKFVEMLTELNKKLLAVDALKSSESVKKKLIGNYESKIQLVRDEFSDILSADEVKMIEFENPEVRTVNLLEFKGDRNV